MYFLRKKYNQKMKFLMKFDVFENIGRNKIQVESHHFKFKTFIYNEILFKETSIHKKNEEGLFEALE